MVSLVAGIVVVFVLVVVGGVAVVQKITHTGGGAGSDVSLPQVTLPAKNSVDPFFGPNAAWNLPASRLGRSTALSPYVEHWWNYASRLWWDNPSQRGQVVTSFRDYSIPIYDARDSTGKVKIVTSAHGFGSVLPADGLVPWNDAWQPAIGNDQSMLIIDPDTGRDYELWLVQKANFSDCLGNGWRPGNLCVGSAFLIPDAQGRPADYRKYEGGFMARGMGLQKLALITRADEVASGSIRHALGMIMFGTMFGPECTASQRSTPAAGTTCGFYVDPATRLEWTDGPSPCGQRTMTATSQDRSKTVPEGMRFALDISDGDIAKWLDSRGYQGALRETARVFAVALRDYGWIVADTSCSHAGIETEGTINPVAHAKWKQLGIPEGKASESLLQGLITEQRMYVVNPPSQPTPASTKLAPGVK